MTTTVERPRSSGPQLGAVGWMRWGWRTLTSMRTALILLLLLALASIRLRLPTAGAPTLRVSTTTSQANPTLGPWLDRLGMFDVFASAWFAAIYLLLCISLVGCIIPGPPTSSGPTANPAASALAVVAHARVHHRQRRRHGFRPARRCRSLTYVTTGGGCRDGDAISAEKGYLHEVGNLLFHLLHLPAAGRRRRRTVRMVGQGHRGGRQRLHRL